MKPLAFKVRTQGTYNGAKGGKVKAGFGGAGALWYEEKTFTIAATQDQWLLASHPLSLSQPKSPMTPPNHQVSSHPPLRFLSVCSGIEAASVAWGPLGWKAAGFAEIEPFPCAVLAHHFPNTPNYGSLTEHASWPIEPGSIDLLVGGTPCQSFSVAGLRKGLNDQRGQLMLGFLQLAQRLKVRWLVWENVPGVLSSGQPRGSDFAAFLQGLVELGYGWSYRVLDAQHFGVPQRRRRVFVVAHLGDWRPAAEVLFEPDCLRGNTPKGRAKGQGVATGVEGRAGSEGILWSSSDKANAERIIDKAGTLNCNQGQRGGYIVPAVPFRKSKRAASVTDNETWVDDGIDNTLNNFDLGDTRTTHAVVCSDVSPTVSSGAPFARTGNERVEADAMVVQPIPIQDGREMEKKQNGLGVSTSGSPAYTIDTTGAQAIAFQPGNLAQRAGAEPSTEVFPTLSKDSGDQNPHVCHPINTMTLGGRPDPVNDLRMTMGVGNNGDPQFTLQASHSHAVATPMAVRRLTPTECLRLQGFPDGWTQIPWKGKTADQCPDGPQYKASGNSMAVPCMRWIGERIAAVNATLPRS